MVDYVMPLKKKIGEDELCEKVKGVLMAKGGRRQFFYSCVEGVSEATI